MTDYAVKVAVRNGRILRAIREAGDESLAAFCRNTGYQYQTLNKFVSMTYPAIRANGDWRETALDLAGILGRDPEDLFTERQAAGLKRNSVEVDMDEAQVAMLTANIATPEALETKATVDKLLTYLTERERFVLQAQMQGGTLDDIGADMGLSQERIRQIQARAHRKLRGKIMRADYAARDGLPQWFADAGNQRGK